MTDKKRILIAVPYHDQKRYCLPQLYQSIADIVAASDMLFHLEVVIRHDLNPYGQKDNVKTQREFFRRHALERDFDFLFFHGADTIPPAGVLMRLHDCFSSSPDVGIASGVYFNRKPNGAHDAVAWINGWETPRKNDLMRESVGALPVTVSGCGMDCVLISRDVFEKISWFDWGVNDDDYPFCDRASETHAIVVDPNVQCVHYYEEGGYSFNGQRFAR